MTRAPRSVRRIITSSKGVGWGVAIALTACRADGKRNADTAVAQSAGTVRATVSTPGDTAPRAPKTSTTAATTPVSATPQCVSEGEWQQCSVERRLTDAGFVLVNKGAAPTDIFPVPGTSYTLGEAQLHVYLFKSAKERERAVAAIDTTTVARPGKPSAWPLPPVLVASSNVVAVLVSDNGRLIERVQNAIRAGLPAAAR